MHIPLPGIFINSKRVFHSVLSSRGAPVPRMINMLETKFFFFLQNKKLEHKLLSEILLTPFPSKKCPLCIDFFFFFFFLFLQTKQFLELLPKFQLHHAGWARYVLYLAVMPLPSVAQTLCSAKAQTCSAETLPYVFSHFNFKAFSCWVIHRLMMRFKAWHAIIVRDYVLGGKMSS